MSFSVKRNRNVENMSSFQTKNTFSNIRKFRDSKGYMLLIQLCSKKATFLGGKTTKLFINSYTPKLFLKLMASTMNS